MSEEDKLVLPTSTGHRSCFILSQELSLAVSELLSLCVLIGPIAACDCICLRDLHEILMSDWINKAGALLSQVCGV